MQTIAKTAWDCREARTAIALKAGGDLEDPVTQGLLDSHLTNCDVCRRYLTGMESTLDVLQASALESRADSRVVSLWPRIAQRLPQPVTRPNYSRFNVWLPTAAMATACAAMIMVTLVQLERAAPFELVVTPQVQSFPESGQPRTVSHEHSSVAHRNPNRSVPQALPVNAPSESRFFRINAPTGIDQNRKASDLEW